MGLLNVQVNKQQKKIIDPAARPLNYFTAIILISTFTNFGKAETCTVSLAGKLSLKYFAYTSFISEKRFMSVMKIVVFTTFSKSIPAFSKIAFKLCITW